MTSFLIDVRNGKYQCFCGKVECFVEAGEGITGKTSAELQFIRDRTCKFTLDRCYFNIVTVDNHWSGCMMYYHTALRHDSDSLFTFRQAMRIMEEKNKQLLYSYLRDVPHIYTNTIPKDILRIIIDYTSLY